MSFLPNRVTPYADETLESLLLRLCRANHFENYHALSVEIKSWLERYHHALSGSFPLSLDKLNIYHSKISSSKRVQALQLLEQLVKLPRFTLLDISFKHTISVDNGQNAQVRYKEHVIPKEFIRLDNTIPVCIECLKYANYVRFEWHISAITCCKKHSTKLLKVCPKCLVPLNYMFSENTEQCACGYSLLSNEIQEAGIDEWRQDSLYQQGLSECDLSEKLALLSFVRKIAPDETFANFMANWKDNLKILIQDRIQESLFLSVEKLNKLSFDYLTGGLLTDLNHINSLPQAFVKQVCKFTIDFAANSPRSKIANIGDSLLSVRDVALILGATINDIYRLYESGVLVLGVRIRPKAKLESYKPVFRLRDVSAIALSFSEFSINQSAW